MALMREAFQHMRNAYGDNFAPVKRRPKENDRDYEARVHRSLDTWAAALGHLSASEIRIGVTRCIREVRYGDRVTPADVVSRARLTPEEMGLPTPRDAFRESLANMLREQHERRWTSGVVHAAAAGVSAYSIDWRMQTEQALWQQFERAYDITCRRHMLGERMDAPTPKALPKKTGYRVPSPETIEQSGWNKLLAALNGRAGAGRARG